MLTTHRRGYTIKVERATVPHPHGTWLSTITDNTRYVIARLHRPTIRQALMVAFNAVDILIAVEGGA